MATDNVSEVARVLERWVDRDETLAGGPGDRSPSVRHPPHRSETKWRSARTLDLPSGSYSAVVAPVGTPCIAATQP